MGGALPPVRLSVGRVVPVPVTWLIRSAGRPSSDGRFALAQQETGSRGRPTLPVAGPTPGV